MLTQVSPFPGIEYQHIDLSHAQVHANAMHMTIRNFDNVTN